MSILSGFFKTKKYRKTSDGYKLQSLWTSSQTVEMNDGNTAETNLGAIKGITSSLASTSSNYALSASAGKNLQDQVSTLNTNLNNHTSSKSNPHGVTKAQIGLDKANNTADVDKCVKASQYLMTFKESGTTYGDSFKILCKYSVNRDGRFRLMLENNSHDVSVAHATYANSAGTATDATKMPKAGGTFTGAIELVNDMLNKCGDDCYFGDYNIGGCMAFKSSDSSNTGIALIGAGSDNMYGRLLINNDGYDMYLCTNGKFFISNGANSARSEIVASAFTQASSRRVKTNIYNMSNQEAEKLLELTPVSYDYINKDMPDKCFGLIAEDVYKIIPSCVSGDVNCADDDIDAINGIGIDYSKLVPYLIKIVQMQQKRLDELEKHLPQ